MKLSRFIFLSTLFGLLALTLPPAVLAEDDAGDDQAAEDDEEEEEAQQQGDDGDDNFNEVAAQFDGDDYIKYWTEYAVLPKSCVNFNGEDVIVFQVFEKGYRQCSDKPMGTYYTSVPHFLQAYLAQVQANQYDMGNDDYALPDSSQYATCTYKAVQGNDYYVVAGCNDDDKHKLAVNIYTDNTCETRSIVDGGDDSNIDISDIQIPFKQCQACVTWTDKSDDEVDDQYYENKQINAPLCSKIWSSKSTCNRKCQKLAADKGPSDYWNKADVFLLSILSIFAVAMLFGIIKKRRMIDEKEGSLLADPTVVEKKKAARFPEQKLFMAFGVTFFFIVLFAAFTRKMMTWFLIIVLNMALFGYLLKLVMEASHLPSDDDDDDDSDDEEEEKKKPGLTNLPEFS